MDSAPPSKSSFNFIKVEEADKSMLEYAKMAILLALEDFPEDDWKKQIKLLRNLKKNTEVIGVLVLLKMVMFALYIKIYI